MFSSATPLNLREFTRSGVRLFEVAWPGALAAVPIGSDCHMRSIIIPILALVEDRVGPWRLGHRKSEPAVRSSSPR